MKKISICLLFALLPLFPSQAGILTSLVKSLDNVPTKVDNVVPESQYLSNIDPSLRSAENLIPSSQFLSETPVRLTPDLEQEARALAEAGRGEIVEKSVGDFYFVPNPSILVDGINVIENETTASESFAPSEPQPWYIGVFSLFMIGIILLLVFWWVRNFFRQLWHTFKWILKLPQKISQWFQR